MDAGAGDGKNHFDELPPEMVLLIFSYIPTKELMSTVRFVCRRFERMLTNDSWWLCRIQRETSIVLPMCQRISEEWEPAKYHHEASCDYQRWKDFNASQRIQADAHLSTVDAIRLFRQSGKRFCLSGSRDRDIKFWDLSNVENESNSEEWLKCTRNTAHNGWIWHIDTPQNDEFLSSGWDETVRSWKIAEADILPLISKGIRGAVTSVKSLNESQAVCSTFMKKIIFLDKKNELAEIASCSFHRGPIFQMAVHGNYIYTVGEDKRIIMVDNRNTSKTVVSLQFVNDPPTTVSVCDSVVVSGSSKGTIRIGDASSLKLVGSCPNALSDNIRQVIAGRGSILALSRSRQFKVFTCGQDPLLRTELHLESEPSNFDFYKGDLAISDGMGHIAFYPCPSDVSY